MTTPINPYGTMATVSPDSTATSALSGLDGDGFLKLLIAQLRYQSPASPSDPTALLQQTSQLSQVETLRSVAASQQRLLGLQQTALASGLIGKEMTAVGEDGNPITGIVEAVRFGTDGPVLVIEDREVPIAAALEFRSTT